MRLFKLITTVVILGLIVLFIYQNTATWFGSTNYKLNLYLTETAFSLQLYVVILLSAFGGFMVGLLALAKPYFRTRRTLASERKEKKEATAVHSVKETPAEAS